MFFGRIDVGRGVLLPLAGAAGNDHGKLRFRGAPPPGRRLRVRAGVRPRRLLGPARRGRREVPRRARASSPATRRTPIRPTAASASTTAWRTPPTSAGSWRPCSKAGAARRCCDSYSEERRPIFRDIGEDIIAGRHPRTTASSSRSTVPSRDRAEFERAFEELTKGLRRRRGTMSRTTRAPRSSSARPAPYQRPRQHTFTARPATTCRRRPCPRGRNVFEELGTGFTLLAIGARGQPTSRRSSGRPRPPAVPLTVVRDTPSTVAGTPTAAG